MDKKTRSKIMSSIRSTKTKPELALKKALRGRGFSYQPDMAGKPDFANKREKIAVFLHGCFWHKCPKHYRQPASNRRYWLPKIEANVKRDRRNAKLLKSKGYKVVTIWEHEVELNLERATKRIVRELK